MYVRKIFTRQNLEKKRKWLISLVVVFCLCITAIVYPYYDTDPTAVPETVTETTATEQIVETTTEETTAPSGAISLRYGGIRSELANLYEYDENFEPEADRLNLAYYYADDADPSDVLHSYAGEEYKKLMAQDNQYIADIYDQAGVSPVALAKKLGVRTSKLLGKYNPTANGQSEENPATWIVPNFKNVNVSFYNADGERINEYSNVKDIMAMASVYSYAHDVSDVDTFRSYCDELYQKSRSYTISIGKVYYDNGCINRSVKEEQEDVEKVENALAILQKRLQLTTGKSRGIVENGKESTDHEASVGQHVTEMEQSISETQGTVASVPESAKAEHSEADTKGDGLDQLLILGNADYGEDSGNDVLVFDAGDTGTQEEHETTGRAVAETVHETASSVKEGKDTETEAEKRYAHIEAGRGIDEINHSQESSKEDAVQKSADRSTKEIASVSGKEERQLHEQEQEQSAENIVIGTYTEEQLRNMDEETLRQLLEDALDEKEKLGSNDVRDVKDKNYCPGHVDLYVKVTLAGFEDENGLRTIPLDAEKKYLAEEQDGHYEWTGWTEEQMEHVEHLIAQDWFTTYGLSISTINTKKPLSDEEISKYMAELSDDVSEERKKVIRFALESVGKIPYYWGGKASGRNYEANGFGHVVSADYKGRVLRGLDCSGWVQWVYWSAIGNNLHASYSTASLIGEGEKIKRADLKPGDIIVRNGADSHVVMFLQWSGNGNMIAIHENSGANNVSVNEVTANYPYYRRLID